MQLLLLPAERLTLRTDVEKLIGRTSTEASGIVQQRFKLDIVQIKRLLLFSLVIFSASLIPSRFSVTITPSLKERVFFLVKSPDSQRLKNGSFVLFNYSNKTAMRGKTDMAIKKIACKEGEILNVINKNYYCNGEYLGTAKDYSLQGEKVINFVFNGIVPPGEYFVMAPHKDSFDSRYFGFISKAEIIAQAYPIF